VSEFDHVEQFGGNDAFIKSDVSEYDRKTAIFALCLAHDHIADLVEKNGWQHEMTVVGDRILTWSQLLEHLRIARRRMVRRRIEGTGKEST
jgi:hypothetical protein